MLTAPPALANQTADSPGSVPLVFPYSGVQPAGPHTFNDADFAAVYEAFLAGEADELALFAQRLKNTPLEVYGDYYQLRLGIQNADPQPAPGALEGEVSAFLARPANTPVIDLLRIEWLKALGKHQLWDLFDTEFSRLGNRDTEVSCYALQSRYRTHDGAVLQEARGLWLDGKSLPDSCDTVFDAARAAGAISEQDIRQRLRLALEINNVSLAVKLAGLLEDKHPGLSSELVKAASDPDRYLAKLSPANASEGKRIIALFALQRLAKQNSELAASRWSKISARFPEAERHYFYGRLAYEAARNLDGRALKWYKAAANTPLNDQQLAWRVRAALRAQNWPEVLAAVNAMRAQQQRESAWRYWKARALQALGRSVEARALYAPLSGEYNFYGQLAADELADSPVLSEAPATYKSDEQAIAAMSALPGVQRTLVLYRTGLRSEALEEWRWVLRNLNDRELLTAAEVARRNEMYDRAIGAAEKTVSLHDFSLRYLAPYRDTMQAHIRENGLDEAWVYGLMRQESRFAPAAKSGVGAAGLMQIMPGTARWAANKLGLKNYRKSLLHQLDTNLRLGTYYMKTVLTQSGNSPVLASAAYNAGPLRALQWRGDRPLEGAIYAETIPFEETREYVKKVMSNTVYYADQFGAAPRSLKQRLGVIAPKSADNQKALSDVP
ncbi:MAG: lytic transglycosylase domain-containing protein [Nitrosomonadales bacterium]|nr:lytic transglycosylase domain-containing protein [Nitrosomonadales bacterium]